MSPLQLQPQPVGPPAQPDDAGPQVILPAQPVVNTGQPVIPVAAQALDWAHFKPEFASKQDDVEVHLLRTNNWIDTHAFPEVCKGQRLCLPLAGEARYCINHSDQ